jgi:hypothetical protein
LLGVILALQEIVLISRRSPAGTEKVSRQFVAAQFASFCCWNGMTAYAAAVSGGSPTIAMIAEKRKIASSRGAKYIGVLRV